jgi:hypothetical protein
MLCKMYLVSRDYLNTIKSNNSDTQIPPPKMAPRKASGQERKIVVVNNDDSL